MCDQFVLNTKLGVLVKLECLRIRDALTDLSHEANP
jgi:hypothetical protein